MAAKKNSLKIVPYAPENWGTWKEPEMRESMLDYTSGSPGDQKETYGPYINGAPTRVPIDWRPNDPFDSTMRMVRMDRGRSATRFWFQDVNTNVMYPMFGGEIVELIQKMDKGVISGRWIVVKKGSNYGVELVDE